MSIFRRPHYTSEITDFIGEMRKNRPTLEAEQRAGRALLWDKHIDREQAQDFEAAEVPQQAYVYQTQAH